MDARVRRLARVDVLLITTGLWFLAKLLRYAFPPLFEPLQRMYEVSNAEIGLAFTGLMFCYAMMQFPSGILRDRFGALLVMVTGAFVAALAAMSLHIEAGFLALVFVMLVIGVGTGLHKTVSIPLLARVYRSRTGRALGVHETFGAGAGVVAPFAALYFLERGGWRTLYLLAGLGGLTLAALALVLVPPRLGDEERKWSPPGSTDLATYFDLFRTPRFAAFAAMMAFFSFAYSGLVAFLPLYLVDVAGMAVSTAGLLYSVLFAATVTQLVTGDLSDRAGRLPLIGICLLAALAGMVGLLTMSSPVALTASVLVFGMAGHGYRPVRDAFLAELIPDRALGGGIGLVRTVLMGAAAVSPGVVGFVADVAGFRPAFGLLALSLLLSTTLAILFLSFDRT